MTEEPRVCALILAAGFSSRMGTLKQLLPIGKSTAVEEAISRFRKAGIEDIRVVVGHGAESVVPVLERLKVRCIFNRRYERGMLSSVLAGLRTLDIGTDAFFLLPADIPLVKPGTIRLLLDAYRAGDCPVVYPTFLGTRGHPPLVRAACVPENLALDYPGGLRAFLARFEDAAREVEVADEAILMDCDRPGDYEKIRAYALREHIPTEGECRSLLARFGAPAEVIGHSRMVARLARLLATLLDRAGLRLNRDLLVSAGYLHDLARGRPDHARKGGELLAGLGYPEVGKVVAAHMDFPFSGGPVDESALLYLADKFVRGERVVSLEERFRRSMEKFGEDPEARAAIEKRLGNARSVRQAVEKALGKPLEPIIRKFERNAPSGVSGGPRKIFLVRHGAVSSPGPGKRYIGQLDLSLSPEGIGQIERLKEELAGAEPSAVFCSDLKRSVETASILTRGGQGPVPVQIPALREIALGQWEGLAFEEVRGNYPDKFEERGRDIARFRPPGGESFFDCAGRVIPAFREILRSTEEDVLIAGHAGVNRIILCEALSIALENLFEIGQDHACLNLLHYADGVFTLRILNGKEV